MSIFSAGTEQREGVLAWLDSTPIPALVLESTWGFPIVEIIHIFGMTLVIGGMLLFNLRLLGVARQELSLGAVARYVRPWVIGGFVLSVLSGLAFILSDASVYVVNPAWRIKRVLLLAAIANLVLFKYRIAPRMQRWDLDVLPPVSVRIFSVISLLLLLGILVAGRLIPYTKDYMSVFDEPVVVTSASVR